MLTGNGYRYKFVPIVRPLKIMWQYYPVWVKWTVLTLIVGPVGYYLVTQFITGATINLSLTNLSYILLGTSIIGVVGLFTGAWRAIAEQRTEIIINRPKPASKVLPLVLPDTVNIGNFTDKILSVDIQAKVVVGEVAKPETDTFLQRVSYGEPFCSNCSRPLQTNNSGAWSHDDIDAYSCDKCKEKWTGDGYDVLVEIKGEVRRNYDQYYQVYQEKIESLIKKKKYK